MFFEDIEEAVQGQAIEVGCGEGVNDKHGYSMYRYIDIPSITIDEIFELYADHPILYVILAEDEQAIKWAKENPISEDIEEAERPQESRNFQNPIDTLGFKVRSKILVTNWTTFDSKLGDLFLKHKEKLSSEYPYIDIEDVVEVERVTIAEDDEYPGIYSLYAESVKFKDGEEWDSVDLLRHNDIPDFLSTVLGQDVLNYWIDEGEDEFIVEVRI